MKYSLFIDESGDFHKSKEWIVSGILCPFDKDIAEKNLKKTLGYIPKQSGLSSHKKLHLTELRQERGHEAAVEIANAIFSALYNIALAIPLSSRPVKNKSRSPSLS